MPPRVSRGPEAYGMGAHGGCQRRELTKPKRSIRQFRMRHLKIGLVNLAVAVQHDVEVECARSPPFPPHASRSVFDALAEPQQCSGGHLGVEEHHLVEVCRLRTVAERLGLDDRRGGNEPRVAGAGQCIAAQPEISLPVTLIGPERDKRPFR